MAMLQRGRLFAIGRSSTKVDEHPRRRLAHDRATLEVRSPPGLAPAAVSRRHFQGQASRSPAMSKLYPVDHSFAAAARLRHADSPRLYAEPVNDPEGLWA